MVLLRNPTQRRKFITICPDSLLQPDQIAPEIDASLESAIEDGIINPLTHFETKKNEARPGKMANYLLVMVHTKKAFARL